MDGVVGIDESRDIVELALVGFAPGLRAAESCLLRAGEDDADFGVLELNALIFQALENGHAHLTAGEVVVGAVDDAVLIPQPVQTDEERDEQQTPEAGFLQTGIGDLAERALFFPAHEAEDGVIEDGGETEDSVALKTDAAELVVDRPLPGGIRMAVKDDAALDFALRLLDGGHVVARLLGEQRIHHLNIGTELHQRNGQRCGIQADRHRRCGKIGCNACQRQADGIVDPAVERTRVLLEGLHLCGVAPKVLGHLGIVFTGLLLAAGAGAPFLKRLAHMRNVADNPFRDIGLLIDNCFEIHNSTLSSLYRKMEGAPQFPLPALLCDPSSL